MFKFSDLHKEVEEAKYFDLEYEFIGVMDI